MTLARIRRSDLWLALPVTLIVGAIAISSQSLWIDEGGTAYKAMQGTLGGWWDALMWERNSNRQLPLYLLYIWGWAKIFGVSEVSLRAANLPPLLVCVGIFKYVFSWNRRLFFFAVLALCTSPFVWFYLNEARPYIFLLASSLALFGAVTKLAVDSSLAENPPALWFDFLALSSILVTATSALAIIWVPCAILASWYFIGAKFWKQFVTRAPLAFAVMVIGHLACVLYYLWTLHLGAAIPRFGQDILLSIFHGGYELLGFSGLGPGRLVLRSGGPNALQPYLPLLVLLFLLWALILFFGLRTSLRKRHLVIAHCAALLPALAVFYIGYQQHVRVSPRYLTPAFAAILIAESLALASVWRSLLGKLLVIMFELLLIISALELRFASRHSKENYRDAAALAKEVIKRDAVVYWGGDVQTAIYYGLINKTQRDNGSSHVVLYTEPGASVRLKACNVIVISRPDVFDSNGSVRNFALEHGFHPAETFQGFQLYRH